jgi:imidazolonepropionase-like amidohydrolase
MKKITSLFLLSVFFLMSSGITFAQTTNEVLIKNATILTASKGTLEGTDILIQNGKIAKIGKGLKTNGKTIDATGKFVTPGIIDAHSHTMLDAINEATFSVTSMTKIRDVLNPNDVAVYRALAGGVTTAHLLHGSANSIGGQSLVVKFKWGKPVDDFPMADALPTIKFAMGENPKRQSDGRTGSGRYPRTRMGVIETMRDAFVRARDYKQAWDDFKAGKTKIQPRKDLELEPLVEVLEGKRMVHCHGYRSDEHLNLLRLAEEFGFKIRVLQHGLEAYKIAPEIAKHGAGVSIFTDSWSYKLEAYDAIPYDAYILWKNGVLVSINSDSDERMRRLNLDAAKIEKYGGVPEEECLKMITLNPAKQLGIDKRTGSIEVGKDADIVIWNAHPFSVYAKPEITMIEGETYFDLSKDREMLAKIDAERKALESAEPNKTSGNQSPSLPKEKRKAHHDDADGHDDGGKDNE